jgi:hypothetical protein
LALVFQGLFFCALEGNQGKMAGHPSGKEATWVKKKAFL